MQDQLHGRHHHVRLRRRRLLRFEQPLPERGRAGCRPRRQPVRGGQSVDGFCCNTTASACPRCQACNVTGSEGTCTFVGTGNAAPHNLCPSTSNVCGNTGPAPPSRPAPRRPRAIVRQRLVHRRNRHERHDLRRRRQLPDADVHACDPYVCGPTACKGMCTVDADCIAGDYCDGIACQTKKTPGTSCGSTPSAPAACAAPNGLLRQHLRGHLRELQGPDLARDLHGPSRVARDDRSGGLKRKIHRLQADCPGDTTSMRARLGISIRTMSLAVVATVGCGSSGGKHRRCASARTSWRAKRTITRSRAPSGLPPSNVAQMSNLAFDWSGLTHDFEGHTLDPTEDLAWRS